MSGGHWEEAGALAEYLLQWPGQGHQLPLQHVHHTTTTLLWACSQPRQRPVPWQQPWEPAQPGNQYWGSDPAFRRAEGPVTSKGFQLDYWRGGYGPGGYGPGSYRPGSYRPGGYRNGSYGPNRFAQGGGRAGCGRGGDGAAKTKTRWEKEHNRANRIEKDLEEEKKKVSWRHIALEWVEIVLSRILQDGETSLEVPKLGCLPDMEFSPGSDLVPRKDARTEGTDFWSFSIFSEKVIPLDIVYLDPAAAWHTCHQKGIFYLLEEESRDQSWMQNYCEQMLRFRSKQEVRRYFEQTGEQYLRWQDFDFNLFGSKGQHEMLLAPPLPESEEKDSNLEIVEDIVKLDYSQFLWF